MFDKDEYEKISGKYPVFFMSHTGVDLTGTAVPHSNPSKSPPPA